MPDPRLYIKSRPCPPGAASSSSRNLTSAVGKVGDLAILNSAGLGKVGQGLRTLASASNSIRQGCGALPTSIGGALGAVVNGAEAAVFGGENSILGSMGLSNATIDAVRAFNPGIANQAQGQAKQLYDQVRQGNFKYTDIPGYLQDFQNLERLGRNIFTPQTSKIPTTQCEPSPYALDLIARAPKHKFMFIVQFVPSPGYEVFALTEKLDAAFMVYETTRPGIKYQLEDVNFYNFRSKYITKTQFEPMTMKFYDDITNKVGNFHAAVLKAHTPVANFAQRSSFNNPEDIGTRHDTPSIVSPSSPGDDFRPGLFEGRYSSASTGPLNNRPGDLGVGNITLFQEIIVYHLFDAGRLLNVYHCYNPRISNLKLSDLSMAESAITSLDITFEFDTCFVDTDVLFADAKSAQDASAGTGNNALYSLKYIASAGAATGPNTAGLPAALPVTTSKDCGPTNTTNPNPPSGAASPPANATPAGTGV